MSGIELLAPAKNLQYGIAAIDCGADAVYIGSSSFGARANAGNSLQDIEELIKYAHLYNAKVYVTINTILDDEQIQDAKILIDELYRIKADAIIIQDVGLLELDLPPIPIHASTQCFINTVEKVQFLESIGVERVILPRETSLNQISEIKKKTNIELESFVHGALCVGYSGQCYLSYSIGKRSGNKGNCAQPCRKKYSLVDANGEVLAQDKYLLSLKDLNLSDYIDEIIEAGVTSFKIEGRLKDLAYLKNVVSYYRRKVDNSLNQKNIQKSSAGESVIDFEPNPYKTFNRGYTNYCIEGKPDNIESLNTSKSLGEPIGKVVRIEKDYIEIKSDKELVNGDGLCFFDKNNELSGFNINKVEAGKIYTDKANLIKPATLIYRNYDAVFTKKLENSKAKRKLRIRAFVRVDKDEVLIGFADENNVSVQNIIANDFEPAVQKDNAIKTIQKQLAKTGDTPFVVEDVDIEACEVPFVPIKMLNEIRRSLLEELKSKRIDNYQNKSTVIIKNNVEYPHKELDFTGNVSNKLAENFYKRHGVERIEYAAESGTSLKNQVVMKTKLCLKKSLNMCGCNTYKEPLFLIDEKGKRFELKFDCSSCEMSIVNI